VEDSPKLKSWRAADAPQPNRNRKLPAIVGLGLAGGVVLVAVVVVLRLLVFEPVKQASSSMEPTLSADELVWAQLRADPEELEHGAIILFDFPREPSVRFIKRIVGLPGDEVELRSNKVIVNGQELPRTPRGEYEYVGQRGVTQGGSLFEEENRGSRYQVLSTEGLSPHSNFGPISVQPGHLFVLGDNRDNSSDSRIWGQVPLDHVVGLIAQDD